MAKKLFLLHLGPETVDLTAMREALEVGHVRLPVDDLELLGNADLEIRRAHKQAGLRRKQVEGAWARACRRAYRARSHCFVSVPGFFDATPEQAALAIDGLAGMKVVLVVTSGFEAAPPTAWTALVKPERTHVLPTGLGPERLAAQVARIALVEEQARLERRVLKLARRRKRIDGQLAA